MPRLMTAASLTILCLVAGNAAYAGAGNDAALIPGQWRIVVEITNAVFDGAPPEAKERIHKALVDGKPLSRDICLTPAMARRPPAETLLGVVKARCSYDSFDRTGGVLKAAMTCVHDDGRKDRLAGTVSGRLDDDHYVLDGILKTTAPNVPAAMSDRLTITTHTTGKRLGDCTCKMRSI